MQAPAVDFKTLLFPFLKEREGYRLDVYPDIKKIPTVGVGHKVTPADNLHLGDRITDAKLQQLFNQDYDRLQVAKFLADRPDYNINQALAIASFIWGHGNGAYSSSQLRKMLTAGSYTKDQVLTYLRKNWDLHSPKNQTRNERDFTLYFQPVGPGATAPISAGSPAAVPGINNNVVKGILAALAAILVIKAIS